MPNALTIAATDNPVVSATAPTASGAANATTTSPPVPACTNACTSSHSLTNPAPSGRPQAPSAATPNSTVVTGMGRASPPMRSRSRRPVAARTDPAAMNPNDLNAAWASRCNSAATAAMAAASGAPAPDSSSEAPNAMVINPMLSVVE